MKKTVLLFIISNILFLNIYSQTKDEIIASFKNIVFKTENTFKGSNIALVSKDFSSSPTGKIYYKLKLELVYLDRPTTHTLTQSLASSLSYDIISTNSLVSPYVGFIILTLKVQSNQKHGDLVTAGVSFGFSDIEQARLNNSFVPCTDLETVVGDRCIGDIKVNYAFQKGKWVLTNIETNIENKIAHGSTRGAIEGGAIDFLLLR